VWCVAQVVLLCFVPLTMREMFGSPSCSPKPFSRGNPAAPATVPEQVFPRVEFDSKQASIRPGQHNPIGVLHIVRPRPGRAFEVPSSGSVPSVPRGSSICQLPRASCRVVRGRYSGKAWRGNYDEDHQIDRSGQGCHGSLEGRILSATPISRSSG
jgi:hypothetical protein